LITYNTAGPGITKRASEAIAKAIMESKLGTKEG
ncbi:MAG: hypothetical protein RLZ02_1498, partial [Actinomycetota bacterium]|jgi:hypothetical protein